jgi:predicted ATPase
LAARLQALAKPNKVLIAESTQRQVGAFELHELPSVDPAQRVWQALGERRGLGRFEALHTRNTPLVGREEETALLVRLWARVKAGDGHAVLLSGEPGVGKSRLAAELEERVRHERHHWLRYFCSPFHHHSALYPIIAQLERAAGFDGDDTPELRLEKLGTLVAPLSPPEDIALLADLLSLPGPTRYPPLDFTPQRKKEKTLGAWLRQIEALSRQQPVLIAFEDLQWIDPTSRVMLDLIIERLALWRVLPVATFRPEFQPPWVGQPQVTMLALNRLDRRDRTALVEQIAGGKSLSDQVINLIADQTDGVPLFVEELTKHVLESGLLREEQDRYVADSPLPRLAIPATLHASLTARLDRLGPAAREVAQLGAVLGREFTYQLAHHVANCADRDTALGQLTAAGLLLCRGALPQFSYLFKHALVQEAGYGILLRGGAAWPHSGGAGRTVR